MMYGVLELKGMTFWANHGGLQEEQKLGQKFIVDLEFTYNMEKASQTDELSTAFSYIKVYEIVKRVVTEERYNLLQRLCYRVAEELFKVEPDSKAVVRIKKPASPIGGIIDYAAIKLTLTGPDFKN
ncbi:MAG: dihydroneopterin aldolase [Zhaonellaceae bacterium]|jgi:dihydroneopterin aldolase